MTYGGTDYGYSEAGYGYGVNAFTGFDGLSIIPDALGWWSVARRVLNRYNGPAIRLRRSSDSAERDFYGIGPQGEVSTSDVRAWNGWNLLVNSVFANSGGAAPTSWSRPVATGTSAPASSTLFPGETAYQQSATGEQPFLNQGFSISTNTTYTFSFVVEAITGTIAAKDVALFVGVPTGGVQSFPVCEANPSGGLNSTVTTGLFIAQLTIGATTATPSIRIGLGITQPVTGTIRFSRPQLVRGSTTTDYEPRTTTGAGDSFLVTLYDQSGLARHFTQSTTTLQPIICEQGVPVTENGRLAAKFVAADARRMSIASSTGLFNALHTTGGTVLAVSRANDTAAAKLILSSASSSTGAGFRMGTGSNEVIQYSTGRLDVAGVATTGNSIVLSGANSQASSLHINAAVLDPDNGTASSRVSYWENGTQGASTNAQTGTPFIENAADNMTLGATSAGGSPHDGPISEVALFSDLISTADRTAWQSRSGVFYGVAIS